MREATQGGVRLYREWEEARNGVWAFALFAAYIFVINDEPPKIIKQCLPVGQKVTSDKGRVISPSLSS